MERFPNSDEKSHEWPKLEVDLTTWDGHWFNLVTAAQARLEGEALQHFNREIGELLWRGDGATLNDLLATINAHMDLIDTSGAFSEYAPQPSNEPAGSGDIPSQTPSSAQNQAGEATL